MVLSEMAVGMVCLIALLGSCGLCGLLAKIRFVVNVLQTYATDSKTSFCRTGNYGGM